MEDAAAKIAHIAAEVTECARCAELLRQRLRAVPGGGHPHAHIMAVAGHPSEDDERSGRPAGSSLVEAMADVLPGLGEGPDKAVYVTGLLKCVPRTEGRLREPLEAERGNCFAYLSAEISTITPHFLLPVGRETTAFILERLFGRAVAGALPPAIRVLESPAFRVVPLASPAEIERLAQKDRRQYVEQLRSLAARMGI